ncbi:UDP-N-acetylglucosamine--peptide N-acetylglucosaminyltransferase-like [Metopolophium dirhodum]|uniref:UDP-N-acetylglucosamine--peptide N-acetylglucosaminyltransferase-like n=1 Tax=Metopolophium dirhodum TaxID=44670 RepID=UPI00298FBAD4|nr:UDP-N-acetylglucosamine--peptide N-acetylglucosaminyltransferase-like [Metopolophium dirhodum]XP_060858685.1 UDP-N-acetylglucosamine--peptide N-acetylglucosaminyltransferase-like [Metopolophium dirhodum]
MSLSKPLVHSELFCSKHTDCEAPISVITEILSGNGKEKFRFISEKFNELRITKVKDLARSIVRKADRDTLAPLYRAIEIYSKRKCQDYLIKSANSKFQNENFMDTQNSKELLTYKQTRINIILHIAKSYLNCKNYEKCIDWLEKAKKINPNCSEVLSNLGLVYMKTSEYELAKENFFEVCSIKPYSVEAWRDYGNFLFETNDLDTADLCYVRVLSIDPKLYEVRNEYGKLLIKLNKIKEAKKEFKIAHNIAEKCPVTLKNLADVYYKCGKFRKSILRYKQVLEIDPKESNVYYFLGMSYLKVEEYQNALNAFIQAKAQEPENVHILKKLALTYYRLDNMKLCTETYKECLILIPEDYKVNLDLALLYLFNTKDYQEAIIYLKKCIQLHPDDIDLYRKLLLAYINSNDDLNASDACMSIADLFLEKDELNNARNAFCLAALMGNAFGHWKLALTSLYDPRHLDLALQKFKKAVQLKPNLINGMMSLSSGIQEIKDKMQWCSSWWCPKHGSLKEDFMPYLNPETPEEEKKALSLAIKRQKHWITKTKVKCCVFDWKSGTDRHSVPPASYSKYLRDLMKAGDGSVQSGHSQAHVAAAIPFLHNLEEILKENIV